MNINRELAIYRVLALRAYEAHQRLIEAGAEDSGRGADKPSWETDVESRVYCALTRLESEQAHKIQDAFPDEAPA